MAIALPFSFANWYKQPTSPINDGKNPSGLRPGEGASSVWSETTDYDHGVAGILQFKTSRIEISATGTVEIIVERVGGFSGAVSCRVVANSTTGDMAMTSGTHFTATTQVVSFADQEVGAKKVDIPVTSSPGSGLHMFVVTMDTATGGVILRNTEMHVYFDDGGVNSNATLITTSDNLQNVVNAGSAGDLFYLRAGTYSSNFRTSGQTYAGYLLQTDGTQFAKVMITNYPGESVTVDQLYEQTHDGQGEGTTVGFIIDADYVHIKGIEITKTLHSGLMRGAGTIQRPVAEDLHIHDLGNPPNDIDDYIQEWHADNIGGTLLDGTFASIHRNCEIHDIYDVRTNTGTSNPWNAYPASGHSGIHGFYLEQAWIHNNKIYKVAKGVFQKNPDDSDGIGHRIHHNDFSQCIETCVSLQFAGAGQPGANYVYVYYNLFDCTATGSSGCDGVSIVMPANEQNSDAHDFWIYNNTKIEGEEVVAGGADKLRVTFNNVIYNCTNTYIFEGPAANCTLSYQDYNCIYSGTFRAMTQRYDNTQTYNSLTSWRAAYPTDTALLRDADENSITTEPTFVNAGSGDYRTTTGVTVGTGRFSRDIGIGSEVVGNV